MSETPTRTCASGSTGSCRSGHVVVGAGRVLGVGVVHGLVVPLGEGSVQDLAQLQGGAVDGPTPRIALVEGLQQTQTHDERLEGVTLVRGRGRKLAAVDPVQETLQAHQAHLRGHLLPGLLVAGDEAELAREI